MIASSLALALGVNVVSAAITDPTLETNSQEIDYKNPTFQNGSNNPQATLTWQEDSSYLVLHSDQQFTNDNNSTTVSSIEINMSSDTTQKLWPGGALTIYGNGQQDSTTTFTNAESNKGIKLPAKNDGTAGLFKIQLGEGEYRENSQIFLNFLGTTDDNRRKVALNSNLEIQGGVEDGQDVANVIATFNGDLKGDLLITEYYGRISNNIFTFNNNSDITGTITMNYGGLIVTYDTGNKTIKSKIDLSKYGTLRYNFAESVKQDKVFTLDTSNNNVKIGGGALEFSGVSQVVLNNGKNVGEGTLSIAPVSGNDTYNRPTTFKNGSVFFVIDGATPNDNSKPILKGNIVADTGSVGFQLSNPTGTGYNPFDDKTDNDALPTDTYYVDGNITITNGGFSAFWDDNRGFVGKIGYTTGHQFTRSGGFVGKNDAWFEKGSFSSPISKIHGASGVSHLGFNDILTVGDQNSALSTGRNSAIRSSMGGGTQIVFNETTTIYGEFDEDNPNTAKKTAIFATGDGVNKIIFSKDVTINGDVVVVFSDGMVGEASNIITFKGNATITGNVYGQGGKYDTTITNKNILTFEGVTNSIGSLTATINPLFSVLEGENQLIFKSTSQANTIGAIQSDSSGINRIISDANLSITGSVSTASGTNAFTLNNDSSISFAGNIDNNAGANTISATEGSVLLGKNTAKITIQSNGGGTAVNTITAKTINSYISELAVNGNYYSNNSNVITATNGEIVIDTINAQSNKANATKAGNFITLASGTATIGTMSSNDNTKNEISLGGSGIVNGNITKSGAGQNHFKLLKDNATLTLNGSGTNGTSHDITSLTATSSGTNTLTLDNSGATSGAMATKIHSVINGENLAVVLNGQDNKSVTLTFDNASGTTLKSVELHTDATTTNTLAFGAGSNKIIGGISVGASKKLTLNLSGANTSLNLVGGLSKGSGEANINIANGANATLSGGAIEATELIFAGASTLTINNSSASFADIEVNAGSSTLAGIALSGSSSLTFNADGTALTLNNAGNTFTTVNASTVSNNATLTIGAGNTTTINALNDGASHAGSMLTVGFNGNANANAKLSILDSDTSDKQIKLNGVSVAEGSTNNTLDLSSLNTVEIGSAVSLAEGRGLTLKLKDTNLTVTGGTDSRITDEAKGALTISVDSGVGSTSLEAKTSGSLNITNLEMIGSGKTTLSLKSNTEIGALTAQAIGGNVLEIDSSGAGLSVITHNLSGNLEVAYKGSNAGTLVINGGTHTLSSVGFDTNGKGALTLKDTFTTIASAVSANKTNTLDLTLRNSELELAGAKNTLTSLDTQGSRIDLSGIDSKARATERKTLSIGTYKANSNSQFVLYADSKSADKVTFSATDGTKADTSATISVIGGADLFGVTYKQGGNDNVELVDASNVNAKGKIDIVGGQSIIGGILAKAELIEDSGKYYIGKIEDRGLSEPYQEIANTALTVNYDLFLANFNSLNKRMGELRDNPHSQGVWARVFGGAMSNDFGAGSKSEYVTAQAGYDYSLTLGNANNYMGIAIAYGKSWTKSNDVSTGGIANGVGIFSLDEVDSNMVEVGIYNSYVMDSGWYNDTIFKFDYIMSEFSLSNDPTKTSTNNFAMVLSDEFGYRYKFAESAKGNWYIDPQVEVAFGYFNQSDFNRMIYDKSNFGVDINATQDSILNLRTRAGMSLGKKFNTAKGFASLYVGAFYEYDYIEGGNTTAGRVGGTQTSLNKLESNGRAIVNIGSNIELTEGVRMYIDVEKSFGDKQRTDMQFNFGARYSFGEKTPTISYLETQKKRVAPLKVEDKQEANTQESKTEASANTEVKQ